MKKFIALAAAAMLIFSGMSVVAEDGPVTYYYGYNAEEKDINYVSEYTLIGSPSDYDGKKVRIVGVLNIENNNSSIYVSSDDRTNKITKNALWINLNTFRYPKISELNGKYVIIEGTFNGLNSGHTDYYSGSIENIIKVQEWK